MTKPRILLVDDEERFRANLQKMLGAQGLTVSAAGSGEEALEELKLHSYDVIVLDIRMPRKSGILMFNELKKVWKFKDIPIIILTGEGEFLKHLYKRVIGLPSLLRTFKDGQESGPDQPEEEVLSKFIDARPEAFLEKPIEPEAFMETVRKVLSGS